ncbi:hypothetical protein ACFFU9_05000 [Mariniflexile ostreae]|uniref:Membrane protein YeaQ/YmgE (Transglycosylase-associated protein family) n=1 Tax=Mariniflexile ostreae TaxID=1520892 RepID=A0ABV5F9G6_9FLAO
MTDTLIAIISIFIGILGANLVGFFYKKYSLGFTGNTVAGMFGSIFFIKLFGRLGFGPKSIMLTGEVNGVLFTINVMVSFLGGVLGLYFIKWVVRKLNPKP